MEYTGLTPTELIDEAEENRKKSRRNRGVPEGRVMGFYEWLLKEYRQKRRGPGGRNREKGKIGVSESMAGTYCNAIRAFYKSNGFELGREGAELHLPKPSKRRVNFKLKFRQPEVKRLLDVCTILRDKVIILMMCQCFQGIGEIYALNYGDVMEGLESGEKFFTVHMIGRRGLLSIIL